MTEPIRSFGPVTVAGGTLLDSLRADMARAAVADAVELTVNERDGYTVRYRTDLGWEEVASYQQAAADPMMPGGQNEISLALSVVVAACVGISKDGEPVLTGDGQPATFHTPELQAALGAVDATGTARAFYRRDGHVIATSRTVLAEAGYGQTAVPTKR